MLDLSTLLREESLPYLQTTDVGLEREYLERYLVSKGYWKGEERRKRHSYVLSPSVYLVSTKQREDLERLARVTYRALEVVSAGISSFVEIGKVMTLSAEDSRFLKLANNAARGLLKPQAHSSKIPPMVKVDLVQDPGGSYRIAEIDTYNPRGFGYAALLEGSLRVRHRRFPGVARMASLLRESGVSDDMPWYIIVSEYERYYDTSYQIFCEAMAQHGVHFKKIYEKDDGILAELATLGGRKAGVFAIPDTLDRSPRSREKLLELYGEGQLKTVYPPRAYLGSKALLPYLRLCQGMQEFLPKTSVVGCHYEDHADESDAPQVLKATVSSGMKGVFFSDIDAEMYTQKLKEARTQKNPSWILQEQVPQKPESVMVFDERGNRSFKDYYLRITAYISADGIVDVEITGRPDRKVHGAPDCIQLPVILA